MIRLLKGISSSGTPSPSAYCLTNLRREIALLPLHRRGGNKACRLSSDCNTGFYSTALSTAAGAVPHADRASLFGGYCKTKQVTIDLYGVCGLRAAELFKHYFRHNRKPPLVRSLYQWRLSVYESAIYNLSIDNIPIPHQLHIPHLLCPINAALCKSHFGKEIKVFILI